MNQRYKGLAITFLAVGAVLLVIGISVWQWPDSVVSEAVAGTPTNKAPWMIFVGVLLFILGLAGLFRRVPTNTPR